MNTKHRQITTIAAICVFAGLCTAAYWAGSEQASGAPPWYSIVPPLVAVTLALMTSRMLSSLAVAVVVGGLLASLNGTASALDTISRGLAAAGRFLWLSVMDPGFSPTDLSTFRVTGNQLILLFVVLVMATIAVVLVGGGLQGIAAWLARFARGRRSTQLVTVIAGLVIFIDDYANTMIVGSTMRPLTDKQRISREKLAFLVDATAAPVAGIALISTWVGYEVGQLGAVAGSLEISQTGYALFLDAMVFRFYCIGMICFVLFNAISGEDFGPMAAAERRAAKTGKLLADGEHPMTSESMAAARPHPDARIRALVAVVPLALVLLVFIAAMWSVGGGWQQWSVDPRAPLKLAVWRDVFSTTDSIPLLAIAAAVGLVSASLGTLLWARIPAAALAGGVWTGIKASLMPVSVLILAWSLKGACDQLHTGEFLAGILADSISPVVFPAMVFAVAGLTSFATGTSWATMAILIPTAIPVAFELDGSVYGMTTILSVAAVLDGAIFGDHCSPISDTTIMSSTASACNHLAHVRTQFPYSLTVAALALGLGYVPAALGAGQWVGILGSAAVMALLFFGLRLWRRGKTT